MALGQRPPHLNVHHPILVLEKVPDRTAEDAHRVTSSKHLVAVKSGGTPTLNMCTVTGDSQ